MKNKLFIAALPFKAKDNDVKALFEEIGTVTSFKVIRDRETNRSKGFGFVEYETEEEAKNAIKILNDYEFQGRKLIVKEHQDKEK